MDFFLFFSLFFFFFTKKYKYFSWFFSINETLSHSNITFILRNQQINLSAELHVPHFILAISFNAVWREQWINVCTNGSAFLVICFNEKENMLWPAVCSVLTHHLVCDTLNWWSQWWQSHKTRSYLLLKAKWVTIMYSCHKGFWVYVKKLYLRHWNFHYVVFCYVLLFYIAWELYRESALAVILGRQYLEGKWVIAIAECQPSPLSVSEWESRQRVLHANEEVWSH